MLSWRAGIKKAAKYGELITDLKRDTLGESAYLHGHSASILSTRCTAR